MNDSSSKEKNYSGTYRNFLFDFDGTLVDSMPFYVKGILSILDKNHITYERNEVVRAITPLGAEKTAEYLVSLGVNKDVDELIREMDSVLEPFYLKDIILKPYVRECLQYMKNRGIKLHILTASPHRYLEPCLIRNDVYDLFENVWSCEDFNMTKTNMDIYVQIAKCMNVHIQNITFLDDNLDATRTAMAAGMRVIGVHDDFSSDEKEQFVKTTDEYIMNFAELMEQIKRS